MPDLGVELRATHEAGASRQELGFAAVFSNAGGDTFRLRKDRVESAVWVFELQRRLVGPAPGRPEVWAGLLLHPPAVPPEGREYLEIGPRDRVRIDYGAFLEPRLPRGRYRVRYAGRDEEVGGNPKRPLLSDWVEFDLAAHAILPPRPPEGCLGCLTCFVQLLHCVFGKREAATCRAVRTHEASEPRAQELAPGYDTLNCTPVSGECTDTKAAAWMSAFELEISEEDGTATVKTRIAWHRGPGVASTGPLDFQWIEKDIRNKWHEQYRLCPGDDCSEKGYAIKIALEFEEGPFVPGHHHHEVKISTYTPNLGQWSINGGTAVAHEFGHLLGAYDEYCTVNEVEHCPPYQVDNLMNGSGKALPEHYDHICRAAEILLEREVFEMYAVPLDEVCDED